MHFILFIELPAILCDAVVLAPPLCFIAPVGDNATLSLKRRKAVYKVASFNSYCLPLNSMIFLYISSHSCHPGEAHLV